MERPIVGAHIEAYLYEETKLNVYNRNTGKTYVLGEKETLIFQRLDGTNTLKEIQSKCPFYSCEEIEKLVEAFSEIGFFEIQRKKFNPLKIKLCLLNPNKLFRENSFMTRIFHYSVIAGSPLLLLTGILMLRRHILDPNAYLTGIVSALSGFNIMDGLVILGFSLFCLSLHEFAHVITARRYGVNVPEIGVMLYFLIPCAYTNISGINLLQSKWKRLLVLVSGSLVNLGLIGICYMAMALFSSPVIGMYAAILMLINAGTIFMNTMVLLKFDGYYLLETILDEPKLREKSISHFMNYLKLIFRGNKETKQTFAATIRNDSLLLQHMMYCFYAVLSMTYVPVVLLNTVVPFFL